LTRTRTHTDACSAQLDAAATRAEDAELKLEQVRAALGTATAAHVLRQESSAHVLRLGFDAAAALALFSSCARARAPSLTRGGRTQAEKKRLEMAHDVSALPMSSILHAVGSGRVRGRARRPAQHACTLVPASQPSQPRPLPVGYTLILWSASTQMRLKLSVDAQHSLQMLLAHQVVTACRRCALVAALVACARACLTLRLLVRLPALQLQPAPELHLEELQLEMELHLELQLEF
jgi:hypothetical protein